VLVRFFSHYISNYSFTWCWAEWEKYVKCPPGDARRLFLTDVIRQCYFLGNPATVGSNLNPVFAPILPPEPAIFDKMGDHADYGFLTNRLRKAMADNAGVDDEVREISDRIPTVDVVEIVISSILKIGQGEADRTIVAISRFADLFREHVLEVGQWRRQLLITTAAEFYRDLPPVFEEVMTFFILNRHCSYPEFLEYFFHTKDLVAALPGSWKLFAAVANAVMKMYLTEGQVVEAQALIREIYRHAAKFYAEIDLEGVAQRFFIGNLIDFGRKFYEVFGTIGAEMNGLILAENVKPGMKEIIETISAFAPE
jgi:hypothetical protein